MTVHTAVHAALELEFYVPTAVWNRPATARFLCGVYSLVEGATLLGGAKGVWRGQAESTTLVRVVVRKDAVDVDAVMASVGESVSALLAAWAEDPADKQDAFMFTVRELRLHEATFRGDDGCAPAA